VRQAECAIINLDWLLGIGVPLMKLKTLAYNLSALSNMTESCNTEAAGKSAYCICDLKKKKEEEEAEEEGHEVPH
jgi:hypothetical protein